MREHNLPFTSDYINILMEYNYNVHVFLLNRNCSMTFHHHHIVQENSFFSHMHNGQKTCVFIICEMLLPVSNYMFYPLLHIHYI